MLLVFFFVMLAFFFVLLVFFFVMLVVGCVLRIPKHTSHKYQTEKKQLEETRTRSEVG